MTQILIKKFFTERNKNIGIARKTMPALRMTAMRTTTEMLRDYNLYGMCRHSLSGNYIEAPDLRNRIQFFSLDNPERIKSTEFNYIWMEEANEFTWDDFITLKTRLSGKTTEDERNHIYLTLNPSDANGWIPKRLIGQRGVKLLRSTYKDNPYIEDTYKQELEKLKELDPNYYRIYALGEWGELKGRIYNNWRIACETEWPDQFDEMVHGIDWGFNNPTAVVDVGFRDGIVYLKERIYETNLTNADVIRQLRDGTTPQQRAELWMADSAEPDRIMELQQAGFNCQPVDKVQNSIRSGIDLCRQQSLRVHPDSVNIKKELDSYKWRDASDGTSMDEPLKFNDHAMDAMRYALCSVRKVLGLRSPADIKSAGFQRAHERLSDGEREDERDNPEPQLSALDQLPTYSEGWIGKIA